MITSVRSAALGLVVVLGCGRVGFDDVTIPPLGHVPPGGACELDLNCGLCARCEAQVCQPEPITALFAGHRSTCYLGASGSRWCAGENTQGDLGLGDAISPHPIPSRVVGDDGYTVLYLGYYNSYAPRGARMWSWGSSQLLPFDDFDATAIASIKIDGGGTCTGMTDGTIDCDPTHTVWASWEIGQEVDCAIKADGTLWCWGTDGYNNTGHGVVAFNTVFANPTQVGTDTDWLAVDPGMSQTCALKTDHTLWCWGASATTGTNGVDTMGVPTQLGTDTDWASLVVHYTHACARKNDGELFCWGSDPDGEPVPGAFGVAVPTLVGTVDDYVLGGHHTCLLANGQWACYGWNAGGQLGFGTTDPVEAPTPLCGG